MFRSYNVLYSSNAQSGLIPAGPIENECRMGSIKQGPRLRPRQYGTSLLLVRRGGDVLFYAKYP